jgi:hypothetical protein
LAHITGLSKGSWTYPRGAGNITPSLEWSDQKSADGDFDKAVEARLTWSQKLYADLTRSSIALFCRVSDQLDDGEQTKVTKFGLLPELYLKIGSHSTLTLVYDYYNWTRKETAKEDRDGVDKEVSLKWKVNF